MHTTLENLQLRKEGIKRGWKEQGNYLQTENSKMAVVSPYQLIINLIIDWIIIKIYTVAT